MVEKLFLKPQFRGKKDKYVKWLNYFIGEKGVQFVEKIMPPAFHNNQL